jgi:sigma-B regulation protein RsbU (phosphoserine phosphatase)
MLAARNPEDSRALFVTALWLRASADGRIRYASSGHNPMLLLRSSGEVEQLESTGKPLGLLPRLTFDERQFELDESDVLCLFTDGLVEARSPSDEEFGTQRLAKLRQAVKGSPMDLTRAIYWAVREHKATSLLEDDLTFMVIERSAEDSKPTRASRRAGRSR